MAIFSKGFSRKIDLTDKEFTLGSTGRSTRASGKMDLKRVKGYGEGSSVTHILESGKNLKRADTESICGKMEIDMKVNGMNA